MASVTISDEARQCLVLFEDETGATARDCLVDDGAERVVFLVAPGEMGRAIGPGGQNVRKVERALGRKVKLVEAANTPAAFVESALAPAVVHNVTVSEGGPDDPRVAYAEVDPEDTGVAIGSDGQNIETARRLAKRHFDVEDIELT
jgi:N utilization substance protein A